MYSVLFFILLAIFLTPAIWGLKNKRPAVVVAGLLPALATPLFFWFMDFWGELLWFRNLGFEDRYLTAVVARVALALAGGLLSLGLLATLTWRAAHGRRFLQVGSLAIGALAGGIWGVTNWAVVLKFIHRTETGLSDPIFDRDTGFYLFVLPFYEILQNHLLFLAIVALGVSLATYFRLTDQRDNLVPRLPEAAGSRWSWLQINAAVVLVVLAAGTYLDRFHLMYAETGVVTGPGWVDVHVRLPALAVIAVLELILAALLLVPAARRLVSSVTASFGLSDSAVKADLYLPAAAGLLVGAAWILGLGVLPGLFQSLVVEPNEITMEKPYIEHNIRFTRSGFGLDRVEKREFPVSAQLPPRYEEGRRFYENIRLWDWRALDAVYQQFQEIRLYYEFTDVDVDRYTIDDRYRQVMISAREMNVGNLPADSRTFVNRRFKYTHGYGITLTDVSEFTPDGLPDLLIKDIPPKSRYAGLTVGQPRIYYGELSDDYVVVNSREQEFDYPSGEDNVYNHYDGRGGVAVSSLWRKFIYGYKLGGINFFLSGYPTRESRIMFHRHIQNRVSELAPFLKIDRDPYVVLSGGKIYWILDAYTVSQDYPYSSTAGQVRQAQTAASSVIARYRNRQPLAAVNYIRNSVKAVIDAYDGTVDFYVFEPDDPLIRTWSAIFPGLLKPAAQMPADLRRHIRYPSDFLKIQGVVYAKYHMTDPMVFYNQEDLWVNATEKYYNQVQPVAPYYIMWLPPDHESLEFVQMIPFTPKNRQVMIGWIAGMCDGDNYGRLLAYNFPKEKRVLGTQQVETKIDQDRYLSGQLSLWDQRGSNVIRGNVLAIPIEKTIIYVEPIYLQADTAAYPELRLVAVMHQDQLSYAETFEEALAGLFSGQKDRPRKPIEPDTDGAAHQPGLGRRIKAADKAFSDYLQALGDKRFDEAARALAELEQLLGDLAGRFAGTAPGSRETTPAPGAMDEKGQQQ